MVYKDGENVTYGVKEYRVGSEDEFGQIATTEDCLPGSTLLLATGTKTEVWMKTGTAKSKESWVKL